MLPDRHADGEWVLVISVTPGMVLRGFRLDGTSAVGHAVSGPKQTPRGPTDDPVVLDVVELENHTHRETFPRHLVELYGITLTEWNDGYAPKVHWETLAYAILDDMLEMAECFEKGEHFKC